METLWEALWLIQSTKTRHSQTKVKASSPVKRSRIWIDDPLYQKNLNENNDSGLTFYTCIVLNYRGSIDLKSYFTTGLSWGFFPHILFPAIENLNEVVYHHLVGYKVENPDLIRFLKRLEVVLASLKDDDDGDGDDDDDDDKTTQRQSFCFSDQILQC
ncbi:hypothetical protein WISP_59750 [Willisornis vidua]|uniref:Uncharacterized protein n=1 Tax=Willisornis vidua TaxID=1566151 RepID=A0ABQ9DAV3_9PASS|nr:hypothetical protein WISP_59750 [Willisornis vidua]